MDFVACSRLISMQSLTQAAGGQKVEVFQAGTGGEKGRGVGGQATKWPLESSRV